MTARIPNWKVIAVDNLNRETVKDHDVCALCSESMAKVIADALNGVPSLPGSSWYKAVPWDLPLWRGMGEFL